MLQEGQPFLLKQKKLFEHFKKYERRRKVVCSGRELFRLLDNGISESIFMKREQQVSQAARLEADKIAESPGRSRDRLNRLDGHIKDIHRRLRCLRLASGGSLLLDSDWEQDFRVRMNSENVTCDELIELLAEKLCAGGCSVDDAVAACSVIDRLRGVSKPEGVQSEKVFQDPLEAIWRKHVQSTKCEQERRLRVLREFEEGFYAKFGE